MNALHDLWLRFRYLSIFDELPEPWRSYAPLLVATLLVFGLAWSAWSIGQALFGRSARRSVQHGRREMRRELRQLQAAGEHQQAGQLLESMGKLKAALQSYRKGGCHEDTVALLLRMGKREPAKEAAKAGDLWRLYGDLCQEDFEVREAAVAFERAGHPFLAARCWQEAASPLDAGRCYVAAGMEQPAVEQLAQVEDPAVVELLERAIRSYVAQVGFAGLGAEMIAAFNRCSQLWLAAGEPAKAFRLAVDIEQLELAVPIARDFLPPSVETAEVCERAGARLVAADLFAQLDEPRREALLRAEHFEQRGDTAEAAGWFEKAEEWQQAAELHAAGGDSMRAAELYSRAGDAGTAARIYAEQGDEQKRQAAEQAYLSSLEHLSSLESEPTARLPDTGGFAPASELDLPSRIQLETEATVAIKPEPTLPPGLAPSSRYHLLEELGRGGMGAVYRAEDQVLQRQVAYKVVPDNMIGVEVAPETLLAEARAAARLSHPNIVQIYDAGRQGQGFFVVMELIEGQTFEQLLRQRKMSIRGVLHIGRQICAALTHAHERRIIHRDLKPSNLMWSQDKRVKLTDFGLAKLIEENTGNVMTRPAGTPSYMAPEQIRGDAVDTRTDLYAFGCVLFELLCRRSVFATGARSFYDHLNTDPVDPRSLRQDVPDDLAELILRCLAKDSAGRPTSAAEINKELAGMLS